MLSAARDITDEILPLPDHATRGGHVADRMGLRSAALPVAFEALVAARETPDDDEDAELLTTREAADLCRVSVTTVYGWVADGSLKPALTTPTGRKRFRRSDVEALSSP